MKSGENSTLIFVYNTNSGTINSILDSINIIVSPKHEKCNLHLLTFGLTGQKKSWKNFIKKLEPKVNFLHKNEFKKKYNVKNAKFPSVFINHETKIKLIISPAEINQCKTADELQTLVQDKIS